jgi:cation:H+ antiporter
MNSENVQEDDDDDDETEIPDRSRLASFLILDLEHAVVGKNELNKKNGWLLLITSMIVIGAACLLLVKTCEWIGSESFSVFGLGPFHGLNIPVIFVSVVLASAATSVPDTIISIRDARAGNYDDAVSNAIGSNIFDVCFALGFPLFLYTILNGPIELSAEIATFSTELRTLLFGLSAVAIVIYVVGQGMGRGKALSLLALYLFFTLYIVGRNYGWDWADGLSEQILSINSTITGR